MRKKFHYIVLVLGLVFAISACQKSFLPSDLDAFSKDVEFSQRLYSPVLGRTTVFSENFQDDFSTKPLTFRISDIRTFDGNPAPELLKPFPVQVWTGRYTGKEKSLEEIEAKRKWENHPLFEIREHSGEFIMWATATSSIVKAMPDSGYVFDVEVKNSGGRKYFTDLLLQPLLERKYEPNNANAITGNASSEVLRPSLVDNIVGDETESSLGVSDISITFNQISKKQNSLRFKFLDPQNQPLDPANFNLTNWETMIHGFNMEKTAEYVKYQVAYPIPLVHIPTTYTNVQGNQAAIMFKYFREGFGGKREESKIGFNFQIFDAGEWEMIIQFTKESPKFDND